MQNVNFVEKYGEVKSPFWNDPFTLICKAFCNLYPDARVDAMQYADLDGAGYGCTDFLDDGSVIVFVDIHLTAENAAEILAHELAHVAVGIDEDHGKEWETAFTNIFVEYNRICENLS